jgi:hypothetical protein
MNHHCEQLQGFSLMNAAHSTTVQVSPAQVIEENPSNFHGLT